MPIEIKDTDNGHGNIILCQGHLLGKDYIDALRVHFSQDAATFSRYRYSLLDYTGLTGLDFSNLEMDAVVQICTQAAEVNPDAFVAMVASKDIAFGLARMAEAMLAQTGWETMVFRTRSEAEQWIRQRVRDKFGLGNLTLE